MTDAERLDWLERQELVPRNTWRGWQIGFYDEDGYFEVRGPRFVGSPTLREAIDAAAALLTASSARAPA